MPPQDPPTREQITALAAEAAGHGDHAMMAKCLRALNGEPNAIQECAWEIESRDASMFSIPTPEQVRGMDAGDAFEKGVSFVRMALYVVQTKAVMAALVNERPDGAQLVGKLFAAAQLVTVRAYEVAQKVVAEQGESDG